jgi:hypothetical protein
MQGCKQFVIVPKIVGGFLTVRVSPTIALLDYLAKIAYPLFTTQKLG